MGLQELLAPLRSKNAAPGFMPGSGNRKPSILGGAGPWEPLPEHAAEVAVENTRRPFIATEQVKEVVDPPKDSDFKPPFWRALIPRLLMFTIGRNFDQEPYLSGERADILWQPPVDMTGQLPVELPRRNINIPPTQTLGERFPDLGS